MMKLLITVLALLSVAFGDDVEHRIVGGQPAKLGQFPYIASLRQNGRHFCGGTIVSNNAIVTAAHCNIGSVSQLTAVVNTTSLISGGFAHKVKNFTIHPYYNANTLENDIAVIRLATNITFNSATKSIPIATYNITANTSADASGWGYTSYPGVTPNNLQWIKLKTISYAQCKKNHTATLYDGQICTLTKRGEGICSGDSGGPLVAGGQLHGVTSAAYLCALGRPDFFTRVWLYRDWVKFNAGIK